MSNCLCGLENKKHGLRTDIVCPVHDEGLEYQPSTPTGQPDKEGSDKNVGNPDTTLDELIDIYDGFITGGEPEIARHSFKASIEAYTAKAVREARLDEMQNADGHCGLDKGNSTYINDRIEQLKQEGGNNAA